MKIKTKCFLDDDFVPDPSQAEAFHTGEQAERDFENSPSQKALRKQQADELGAAIAKNLITLCQ